MEGFFVLLVLSVAMFLGCYLAGMFPLIVTFSEKKMKFISVFGAGLLVGTALAVIIPEGVETIYHVEIDTAVASGAAFLRSHVHHKTSEADVHKPVMSMSEDVHGPVESAPLHQKSVDLAPEQNPIKDVKENKEKPTDIKEKGSPSVLRHSVKKRSPVEPQHKLQSADESHETQPKHDHSSSGNGHSYIGFTLVLGFIVMLVVDQISQQRVISSYSQDSGVVQKRYSITATIGLVVHAAADGIALAAASSTKGNEIQLIVFIAIMLHKAPAAFGLVTFLLLEGVERSRIRKHLLVFAMAAPVGAIVTYIVINQSGSQTLGSMRSTGILMLFSAGTFLYVATVHVLPEVVGSTHSHSVVSLSEPSSLATSSTTSLNSSQKSRFTFMELCGLVAGALIPAFIALGHSH